MAEEERRAATWGDGQITPGITTGGDTVQFIHIEAGKRFLFTPKRWWSGALLGAAFLTGLAGAVAVPPQGPNHGPRISSNSGSNSGPNQGSDKDRGKEGENENDGDGNPAAQPSVTYCRDVAPVLQTNCQECHRPSGIGPFPLLTYVQAKVWASLIADYTHRRVMPPWKAAPDYGEFEGERRLTDAQIQTIAAWVKAGTPEGDPKDLPPPRQFTDGWQLGTPDLVLDAGAPYPVPANQGDVYRAFVLPFHPKKDTWVTAIEVLPGARSVVHHIDLYLDPQGRSPLLDQTSPGLGFPTAGFGPDLLGEVQIDAWAAGAIARFLPPDTAWKIPANAYLVMEVHYSPTPKAVQDRTRIGLHFAKGPIDKRVRTGRIGNVNFRIPAGAAQDEVTAGATLPLDIHVLSVWPHMHLIGRELKATATLPGGIAKPLIWIPDWDVHWQLSYTYKEPQKLSWGSRMDVIAHYDNSANNPNNPNRPPQPIGFGPRTTDEMCYLYFRYTVDREHITHGQPVDKDGIEGITLSGQ
jgi:hypothetical protein